MVARIMKGSAWVALMLLTVFVVGRMDYQAWTEGWQGLSMLLLPVNITAFCMCWHIVKNLKKLSSNETENEK